MPQEVVEDDDLAVQ